MERLELSLQSLVVPLVTYFLPGSWLIQPSVNYKTNLNLTGLAVFAPDEKNKTIINEQNI